MDAQRTDDDLARLAQAGDGPAFEELVRRTTRMVYARIYLDTGEAHRTEDLVQETFLAAFKSIRQLTNPAGFRSWLLTVAQRITIDSFRREGRLRRTPTQDGPAPERAAAAEEPLERAESRDKVRAILQSLPEAYRLPLTLRYIDGADYESISLQLGMTNGSLRGLLNRGMQILREQASRVLGPELIGGRT